jgi:hypothetical protein
MLRPMKSIDSASNYTPAERLKPQRELIGKCRLSSSVDPIDSDTNGVPALKVGDPSGDRIEDLVTRCHLKED